jgi:hypothetical protein
MRRELFQTALEFCHDLLAEWEWKKGERAGLGEEYDELLEFISTLKHEIEKQSPDPVMYIGELAFNELKKGWCGDVYCTNYEIGPNDVPLYAEPPASKLTKHDAEMLKCALEKLISVAEKCDSWESFPSKALDEAYAAIDSCSINRAI